MKQRQLLGIIIPVGILIILLVIFFSVKSGQEDKSSSLTPMAEFAIKDTATIDQVRITEANGVSILVQRRTDALQWKLNEGQFNAREDAIGLILETVYRIRVKQEVDKNAMNNIITQIASRNKKVEFFRNGEDLPFKTYYIGSATPDKLGTYMLLKVGENKSNAPYIMYKPGMYGHLESRFFADATEWRSTSVFKFGRGEIAKIHLHFFEEPQHSHVVELKENGDLMLTNFAGEEVKQFDVQKLQRYVTLLKELNYEGFNNELNFQEVDSVRKSTPLYTLSITDGKGIEKKVIIHRKSAAKGMLDHNGDQFLWDKDRYWGHIEGNSELLKLQFFSWGPVFKPIIYFTEK
ncbi:MAG: hypothetical protein JKY54_09425 [Flavobacteriales bacterium]|nr:hypothetical protein [Flavobacteriales bacterium]